MDKEDTNTESNTEELSEEELKNAAGGFLLQSAPTYGDLKNPLKCRYCSYTAISIDDLYTHQKENHKDKLLHL